MLEVVDYRGWTNNLKLSNASVELIVTLDVGPRVIAYRAPGGFNVMKNYDEMMGGTGEAEWQIRGGTASGSPRKTSHAPTSRITDP